MDRVGKVKLVALVLLVSGIWSVDALPRPDSAGHVTPPPGLAYGGIPYGSMSGDVANYFKQREAPSVGPLANYAPSHQTGLVYL